MKALLLMMALLWLGTPPAGAQNTLLDATSERSLSVLQDMAAPYFKTLPYHKSFSSFLQEMINDPDLQDQVINRRTDSSFFYLSGTYRRYNPFIYRPSAVKLVIAESEFTDSDTSRYRDTVVYCQLVVTADTSQKAKQFVQKEYSRLLRKASRTFTHQSYSLDGATSVAEGALTNSFIPPFAVSPVAIAWGREATSRAYVFSLTLRLKVNENRTWMVTLPQEFISRPL